MERAGEQLLAGARLAADQHREVAKGRDPRRLIQRLPQCGTGSDDGLEPGRPALRVGEATGLDPASCLASQPLQEAAQQIEIVRQSGAGARHPS